jgi:PAS domain S-box-containing protein
MSTSLTSASLSLSLRLSTLIDNLDFGIIFEDGAREIVHVNSKFYEVFNIPPRHQNFTNHKFVDKLKELLSDEKLKTESIKHDVIKQFIYYTLKSFGKEIKILDEEVFFIDGRVFQCIFIPVELEGSFYGYLWKWIDISQRKRIEIELKEVARFATNNPSPVMRINEDGKLIYANRASNGLLEFWKIDINQKIPKKWRQILLANPIENIDKEFEVDCGKEIYSLRVVPVADSSYFNLYGIDITAHKLAKEKIEKLSWVASVTDNAVIITDNRGKIEWVNDGFTQITGYRLDELNGSFGDVLRKGDANSPLYSGIFKTILRSRKPATFEALNYTKNGKQYWCQTRLTPMFDENGNVYKLICIESDISSLKKNQNEFKEQKELAEQSERFKEQFLANISHEIRTPMNAIQGMTGLMLQSTHTTEQEKYLNIIKSSAENLLIIINDILDLSKIEAGKINFLSKPFECATIISHIKDSLDLLIDKKKVCIIQEVDEKIPLLMEGDPVRLNQILLNLANNAVKFTEKGKIILRAKLLAETATHVSIFFSVSDTGIGIPQSKLDKIFEPFTQLIPNHNDKYKRIGTGLGLSIVKQLIELQNGTIRVNSKPGKGSEFSFMLSFKKLKGLKKSSIKPFEVINKIPQNNKMINVLVAEDNEANRFVVQEIFKKWRSHFNLLLAETGKEVIDSLNKNKIDIIVMDIEMPVMNGYETTVYIRKQMRLSLKKLPIIALTAHATTGEAQKCKLAGMNDYLTKPFNPEEVYNKIISYIKPL